MLPGGTCVLCSARPATNSTCFLASLGVYHVRFCTAQNLTTVSERLNDTSRTDHGLSDVWNSVRKYRNGSGINMNTQKIVIFPDKHPHATSTSSDIFGPEWCFPSMELRGGFLRQYIWFLHSFRHKKKHMPGILQYQYLIIGQPLAAPEGTLSKTKYDDYSKTTTAWTKDDTFLFYFFNPPADR